MSAGSDEPRVVFGGYVPDSPNQESGSSSGGDGLNARWRSWWRNKTATVKSVL